MNTATGRLYYLSVVWGRNPTSVLMLQPFKDLSLIKVLNNATFNIIVALFASSRHNCVIILASLGSVVPNMFRQAKRWGRRTLATPVCILAGCTGCHNATEPGLDVEPLAGARVRPVYRVLRACRRP